MLVACLVSVFVVIVAQFVLIFFLLREKKVAVEVAKVAILQRQEVMGWLQRVVVKSLTARDRRTKQKARGWLRRFAEEHDIKKAA